jgi:hypothetical protein
MLATINALRIKATIKTVATAAAIAAAIHGELRNLGRMLRDIWRNGD